MKSSSTPATGASLARAVLAAAAAGALAAGVAFVSPHAQAAEPAAGPALRLTLLAQVVVREERVHLGDLVSVAGDDAGLAALYTGMDLGPAPRVAQPAEIDRAQIDAWLRVRQPGAAPRIEWSGADRVRVARESQDIDGERIDAAARRTLSAWLATRSERFDIEAVAAPVTIQVPPGKVSVDVRALPAAATPSAHATLWIDLSVNGRFYRSVTRDYRVRAYRTGWVTDADLPRGADLAEGRVHAEAIDIAARGAPPWRSPVPEGARLRRPLARGQLVAEQDVEPRPLVTRGEQVVIFSRSGELSIEATAEALQDGREGQAVLVRIPNSKAPVQARVLRAGLVEIKP